MKRYLFFPYLHYRKGDMFYLGGGLILLQNQIALYDITILFFKNHSFLRMSVCVHKESSERIYSQLCGYFWGKEERSQ